MRSRRLEYRVIRVNVGRSVKRIGYALDMEETWNRYGPQVMEALVKAQEVLGLKNRIRPGTSFLEMNFDGPDGPPWKHRGAMGETLRALLFAKMADLQFGGSRRDIHYQDTPDILGKTFQVRKTRRAVLGTRSYDADEGMLLENQTHVHLFAICPPGLGIFGDWLWLDSRDCTVLEEHYWNQSASGRGYQTRSPRGK